jgi:hypothetical protein
MREDKIHQLEAEIEKIKERNKRVESDKAWETSKTRMLFVSCITFALAYFFMILVGEKAPFWKALAGSIAYIASTTTYGILKSWWLKRKNR